MENFVQSVSHFFREWGRQANRKYPQYPVFLDQTLAHLLWGYYIWNTPCFLCKQEKGIMTKAVHAKKLEDLYLSLLTGLTIFRRSYSFSEINGGLYKGKMTIFLKLSQLWRVIRYAPGTRARLSSTAAGCPFTAWISDNDGIFTRGWPMQNQTKGESIIPFSPCLRTLLIPKVLQKKAFALPSMCHF